MVRAIVKDGFIQNIIIADATEFPETEPLPDEKGIGDRYDDSPTEGEQLRADVDFLAAMAGVSL